MIGLLFVNNNEYCNVKVDDKLIIDIGRGDRESFSLLYELISGNVYGFALSITKNTHDAEDVLQETFLKVYSKAGEYIPEGKPLAWIFRIARNLSLTKIRDRSKECDLDENRPVELDFSFIANVEQKLLLEKLFEILSDEEKQILLLHSANGMKHRQIADLLGLSLNTVLSKYHRGIKKLKEAVRRDDDEK